MAAVSLTNSPTLRLFRGAEAPNDSSGVTLRDAYLRFVLPRLERQKRRPRTIAGYRTALSHWERFSANPPVELIRTEALEKFLDALLACHQRKGESGHENVRKTRACLGRILAECGRSQGGEPPLIDSVPHADLPAVDCEQIEESSETRRRVPIAELGACFEACASASWPAQRVSHTAAEIWRGLLLLATCLGPRRDDLLNLQWGNFSFDVRCPHPKYAEQVSAPHGWLWFLPTKTRAKKPERLLLPLPKCLRSQLERMRRTGAGGRVFALPNSPRRRLQERHTLWRTATGRGDDWKPYTWQELRYTCSCLWNDMWPGLGEHVTGHAPRGVNARHYDENLHRLVEHVDRLRLPPEFSRSPGPRQLRLF